LFLRQKNLEQNLFLTKQFYPKDRIASLSFKKTGLPIFQGKIGFWEETEIILENFCEEVA